MFSQPKDGYRWFVFATVLITLSAAAGAEPSCRASDACCVDHCPQCRGDQDCRCQCEQCQACRRVAEAWWRLSDPQAVARYAIPSNTRFYAGGYVGGGTVLPGDVGHANEGTWGWDYGGLLPTRIWLNWSHGRRYQGGSGAYKSDGPKLKLHH
jgi:hypothetical protein